ncbi:pitrilysin family protein [Pseudotenacibaculum sp. MALMAid0570]|uniref:M16 family metallopeptidase n=1 Tax=Pseudotenacibaculum sp. MALMAid0570 TaxID=3143938 RepID=UPI0032DEFC02
MKTKILSIIAILAMSFAVNAQIDRSKMPKPGPAPKVKLGKAEKFKLKNGLTVIMVENHKLPRASASLTIDNYPRLEGDKAGVTSMMGSLLGRGTANISKDDFNEKIDFLGANVSFSSGGASASSLIKYFPEILGLMADGVKNSVFSQEEFDKEVKVTLDNIKSGEKSVTGAARRVERVLTYGKNHPFGEFISKESVNNITLEDVKKEYNTYYRPNNAYLIIIGDINPKKTKKMVKKLFGDWNKGTIPSYTMPEVKNVETTEINFINMPNAVQSEIAVINTVDLTLGDDDYFAALLANQILGGGGTARLFQNLREDKAYTYGSYSSISQNRYVGRFSATASVRNMVTDSSVVELMKEINTIRYKKVTEKELKDAKEQYIGSFVINAQRPASAATYALEKEIYNLPDNFYETYLAKINAVTIDDLQNAAIKYFRGDKARIVITGKAIDVLKNLEKNPNYNIKYFDKYGNSTEKPEMSLPIPAGLTASKVIDNYVAAIGGKEKVDAVKTMMFVYKATIQGNELELTRKIMGPNKESNVITFGGQVFQKQVFNGETGYAVQQGRKQDLAGEELENAKAKMLPFEDMAYKKGKLDRIESIDGENVYIIKYKDVEIFYSVKTGLKLKSTRTVKGPQGEVKVPSDYSDYKEVNGILIPHKFDQGMGRFTLNFELKEVKINEGVTEKDFE